VDWLAEMENQPQHSIAAAQHLRAGGGNLVRLLLQA
jgi:hypothetical protein